MKRKLNIFILIILSGFMAACGISGDVVKTTTVSEGQLKGIDKEALAQIEEIREAKKDDNSGLENVIQSTPNYSVEEYLALNPDADNPVAQNYTMGGYDIINIIVYEEPDLSRESVPISADGYFSFPLIGRIKAKGLTTSELERFISEKLAEGQLVLDAHVSVNVSEYKSRKFMALGSIKTPGTYSLQAQERVLDAISKTGGIDFEQGGKEGMVIRTLNPNTNSEKKIVIRIDLPDLLKGGNQQSNLLLMDKDLIYIPKAEYFYIIGQVKSPGSQLYLAKEITLVEAISMAGGFTPIAARNRTRVIRIEDGVEKVIEVQVDAITKAGKKAQDILIKPNDVIVVPESFF